MPKVSIITPCNNEGEFIARTIESIRNQTFRDWEHIVVDDGSTDDSATLVEAILPFEPCLRLVTQPNGDRARACNNGFRHCSSESRYLMFLDADDCLEPQMLEVMSSHLDSHPDVGLVYCGHTCIDAEDKPLEKRLYSYLAPRHVPGIVGARELSPSVLDTPFASVFTLAGIICSLSLIRRSVYECSPGWDENFGFMYDDTDLFLQIAVRSKIHYLDKELVRYRRHSLQSTQPQYSHRYVNQEQKLYSKWLNMCGLTDQQRQEVKQANRFREGKLRLYRGIRLGNQHLQRLQFREAARQYYGAARTIAGYWVRRAQGQI